MSVTPFSFAPLLLSAQNVTIKKNANSDNLKWPIYIDAGSTTQSKTNGFIAQEVQSLFPEVVSEKNGYLGISYESMIPLAIKAIQEQQVIIDTQEERIAKLEALVQELIAKEN